MSPLKITLAADGASDKMLLSVIDWITSSYNDVAFNRVAFICLAGTPPTMECGLTSFCTTLPAPITLFSPIVMTAR